MKTPKKDMVLNCRCLSSDSLVVVGISKNK